jgi:Xaa-Pro aminopeptidase
MILNGKLNALRAEMKKCGVDAVIIPSGDPHQSEYVADHWQERVWISEFTGSAGVAVVTHDHAGVWTDSRYFIQAEMELKGTGFVLHKMYNQFEAPYVAFLAQHLKPFSVVAVDGTRISTQALSEMKSVLEKSGVKVVHHMDIISQIWHDRPPLVNAPVEIHQDKFAGKSIVEKLAMVREEMEQQHVDSYLITALDEVAWIFNIRGKDVPFNPVNICYAVVERKAAILFVDERKAGAKQRSYLKANGVTIRPYTDIVPYLKKTDEKQLMLVDSGQCSQAIFEAIHSRIELGASIIKKLKAIKNDVEINHIRQVMRKDGAALAEAFHWLEAQLAAGKKIPEATFAEKIAECRSKQKHYAGESFSAIIGYRENGAIIHYHPEPETCKNIEQEGILLVDSGGQYQDGTTDITRTITLGNPSEEEKLAYTCVLRGMINLSRAIFPKGTSGVQLDTLARQFLWQEGMNYGHGTGHGVGFYLNVHEPPQGFAVALNAERGKTTHVAGMLTSNEPGFYKPGAFGMRIENLILTKPAEKEGFLSFETVTLYPFEHALIDKKRLTKEEISWINNYHSHVYKRVSPFLNDALKVWFKNKCRKI